MTSYYIQTNVMCLLILAGLYFLFRNKKGVLPAKQRAFDKIILCSVCICVADLFAWTFNGKPGTAARIFVEGSNMIYFAAITWTGVAWLNYVNISIHALGADNRKRFRLSAIPAILMTGLLVINPLTHYVFSVDENNVCSRGDGTIVHWIVSWGYLFFATWITLRCILKAKTRIERKQYYPLLSFIVLPAIAAVCQMIFYGVTATQCGVTLSIAMISFGSLREQISSDTLTGLNNRKALENYISTNSRKGQKFTVLFCDIDHFKQINDTLGHVKGDIALKEVADVLRYACKYAPQPLFLCRYGGDEFIICGTDLEDETLETFSSLVLSELGRLNEKNPDDLHLEVSIGYESEFCDSEDDVEALVRKADETMYKIKNQKKSYASRGKR